MSADGNLGDYVESDFEYTPLQVARNAARFPAKRELDAWGLDPDTVGSQPDEIDKFGDIRYHRYQFDRIYFYPRNTGDDQTDIYPVEFRVYINTIGDPPQALKDHLRNEVNPHLQGLFDTGPYDGWMSGFGFIYHASNIENQEIPADEANNIGMVQWDVTVRREGRVVGEANGFADPFALMAVGGGDTAPQQEVWNISGVNQARDSYQIAPEGRTSARERAKAIAGKDVYLNGKYIGSVTDDGRVWLKRAYDSGPTYRGRYSRESVVEQTDATYSAIRDGGNAYKTRETDDEVYLVTARAKPDDFDATSADRIDPTATGEMIGGTVELGLNQEATTFNVRRDTGSLLGKYSAPETRTVSAQPDFGTAPYGVGGRS